MNYQRKVLRLGSDSQLSVAILSASRKPPSFNKSVILKMFVYCLRWAKHCFRPKDEAVNKTDKPDFYARSASVFPSGMWIRGLRQETWNLRIRQGGWLG